MVSNLNKIEERLIDNKILIIGFGIEGQSTYRFIRHFSKDTHIGICDKNTDNVNAFLAKQDDNNVATFLGEDYLERNYDDYKYIFKTPGIPIEKLKHFTNQSAITSQIDMFLEYYGNKVIGITGTKGKSTTASLLHKILIEQNQKSVLVGNIGIPAFDIMIDGSEYDYYICELSSHQLETVQSSPHIGLILNIYQDHLDYYQSYQKYIDAKFRIFSAQNSKDYLIIGENVDIKSKDIKPKIKTISLESIKVKITYTNELGSIDISLDEMMLKGHHNLINLQFCLSVCEILESENEKDTQVIHDLNALKESIIKFEGLPHRMEYVGEYDGIHFYNDSICTIPEAAISAIKSFDNTDTIILGGFDRKIDYTDLCEFLSNKPISNVILLPDSGYRIYDDLKKYDTKGLHIFKVYDMDEAVMIALRYTKKGKTCLFSPAAASYTFYKNFIERGNHFKDCVALYASHV